MSEAILGVDPGKSGGLGLIFEDEVSAFKMPQTERDTNDLFRLIAEGSVYDFDIIFAFIELVHPIYQAAANATWKFGQHYGMLRAFLIAYEIPFETVTPPVWQRSMRCLSKGDKNVTKARAQELFPSLKIIHATADALLIAEYGRRKRIK